MDHISTYGMLGIPEALASAIALAMVSLALAPWLGGYELGPIKIPSLSESAKKWLRFIGPIGVVLCAAGFLKVWQINPLGQGVNSVGPLETSDDIFSGKPKMFSEMEARELKKMFGESHWDGGAHWGKVTFDARGIEAKFTNESGASPGSFRLVAAVPGTVPILVGEWRQDDGQAGRALVLIPFRANDSTLHVFWGPAFRVDSAWTQTDKIPRRDDE